MKFSTFTSLGIIVIISLFLFACGGGGGGGAAPTPTLTADKMTGNTPVLNGGTTTLTFDFGAVNAGKTVTFTSTPAATLTPPSTVLDSLGKASVVVSAAPSDVTVNVTASITGLTGTKAVPFIKQPDKVVVQVKTDQTISNLSALSFGLQNDLVANFADPTTTPNPLYNSFGTSTLYVPGAQTYLWNVNVVGLNTNPLDYLFDLTFIPSVASAGVPHFKVYAATSSPDALAAVSTDATGNVFTTKALATTNFIISAKYYLGATLLATN